ncbi:MAG TPA: glycosyltransferase [Gaiellaceae bacterium]
MDVVMPAYNAGEYIAEAIESVLAQTHGDLELFVVDDGSTDETREVVASFRDGRVNYLHRDHGGPSAARNTGIRASGALFVAFLDADDRWRPDKLAAQIDMLNREPSVGLVHGFQLTIDARGAPVVERRGGLRGYVFDALLGGNLVTGSASVAVVRRSALERLGTFREDLPVAEDWEMWLRIARKYAFDHVPEILVEVRAHEKGLQQNPQLMAEGRIRMHDDVVASMRLTRRQRARFAEACFKPSIYDFALAEKHGRALHTLLRLVAADRRAISELRSIRYYLWLVIMAAKEQRRALLS